MSYSEDPHIVDLAQPRHIVLQGRKGAYKLLCRRPSPSDWSVFYDAIAITLQRDGADQVRSADYETASRVLAQLVLDRAEGYHVDGGRKLDELPNWPMLVPLEHRLKIGEILASVRIEPQDDEGTIYPEGEPVFLSCIWNPEPAPSPDDEEMRQVSGLKHVLKTPSEAQYRRYARESSRSRILGGSRAGTTLYPGAQMVLAALYDELIVSVNGYAWDGKPLADPKQIAEKMDTHHKVVAAQQLFTGADRVAARIAEE